MPNNLRNLLIRNTIGAMRTRTYSLDVAREPNTWELNEMAKRLIRLYPSLKDGPLNSKEPWVRFSYIESVLLHCNYDFFLTHI